MAQGITPSFTLSYELSTLVPVNPILAATSKGLLGLVREFQNSGSDLITEHDLAEVFGRNIISQQFASTFRTTVRKSTIHRLAGIAEIVLEAGAGPTVEHAVTQEAFFPMLVQLSVLLWAHNATSLATSLSRIFEVRAVSRQKSSPTYTQLIGTLRCIQQQTSGFLWELYFSAVDEMLKVKLDLHPSRMFSRTIPHTVLSTLIDALPVSQRFPENYFLTIRTSEGLPTLVVWIHHVLGLTMELQSDKGSYRVGLREVNVFIDCRTYENPYLPAEITLLNETKDITFRAATDWQDDPVLESSCRHTLQGFCAEHVDGIAEDRSVAHELLIRFIHRSLKDVQSWQYPNNPYIPSRERILKAAEILFYPYEISWDRIAAIESDSARDDWEQDLRGGLEEHDSDLVKLGRKKLQILSSMLWTVSKISNLEECRLVPLRLDKMLRQSRKFYQISSRDAFENLASLLLDKSPTKDELTRVAVLSSWGWSLCISTIFHSDPADSRYDLVIKHGVPSRFRERKECIMDVSTALPWSNGLKEEDARYTVVAKPGDIFPRESFLKQSSTRYFIATTDAAFKVYLVYKCYNEAQAAVEIRLGLRSMQDAYWNTYMLPHCDHTEEATKVPDQSLVFTGVLDEAYSELDAALAQAKEKVFGERELKIVHISKSAGNPVLRWLLLVKAQSWIGTPFGEQNKWKMFGACYLRTDNCCLDCTVQVIKSRSEYPLVLLIG